MIIPTKEEYCKAKADSNTYEEIRHCIDPWSGEHVDIPTHYVSTPEMYYDEYDDMFNSEHIASKLRKNIKKYNQVSDEIENLCNGFKRKTFPKVTKALCENLEELIKTNNLVITELEKAKRILRLAK